MLTKKDAAALRMERLCLPYKADGGEYDRLFRDCSPVPMEGWSEPGSPPSLSVHAAFDDYAYNALRRRRREILKGRFTGELIGYVAKEDLELYACLFRKELKPAYLPQRLMELLRQEGPMSIGLMKEFSGLLVKELTPALHKLQAAFLVYEDQSESGGDRGWFLFEDEFPDVNLRRYSRAEALALVLPRFARRNVFFDLEMAQSFYRLSQKELQAGVARLLADGGLVETELEGRTGWLLPGDYELLRSEQVPPAASGAVLIQRNDFLVKSNAGELSRRFPAYDKWEPLYYLLIDGDFHGVVIGRFKFGPHVVENVVVDLPEGEAVRRREEILAAVAVRLDPAVSPVHRYNGAAL